MFQRAGRWSSALDNLRSILEKLDDTALDATTKETLWKQGEASLASLTRSIQDMAGTLTPYEKRNYNSMVKVLSNDFNKRRKTFAARPRFGFKVDPLGLTSGASSETSPKGTADNQQASTEAPTVPLVQTAVDEDINNVAEIAASEPVIPSLQGRFQIKGVELSHNSSISLMNIDRSVLMLHVARTPDLSLASLFVRSIKDSLLICNQISSGIHITNASSSTLVVRGKQVRIHAATDCVFYLHSGSRPVIESCSNVKFAPLPHVYELEGDQSTNYWNNIDDFQWLRPGPSPNWGLLAPGDHRVIQREEWESIIEESRGRQDVEQILRLAKIPLES